MDLVAAAQKLVTENLTVSILLSCCAGLFTLSVTTTVMSLRLLRKNDSLVELLVSESTRHSGTLCALSEKLNDRYYAHQQSVSIEHIATLRSLLDLLPTKESEKPGE